MYGFFHGFTVVIVISKVYFMKGIIFRVIGALIGVVGIAFAIVEKNPVGFIEFFGVGTIIYELAILIDKSHK